MRNPKPAQLEFPFPETLAANAMILPNFYCEPLPVISYHYTDVAALIGIVERAEIWASHVSSMNDRSEQSYALKPMVRAIKRMVFKDTYLQHELIRAVQKEFETRTHETFVACLSALPDDIGQWRGYAAGGNGFAIGLATTGEFSFFKGLERDFPMLVSRVIYDPIEQDDIVIKGLGPIVSYCECHPVNPLVGLNDFKFVIPQLCARYSVLFKNQGFEAEEEVRPVLALPTGGSRDRDPFEFRAGQHGITPYVRVPFERSAIRQIFVGPRQRFKESCRQLEVLLWKHNLEKSVQLRPSNKPFR